VRNIFEISPLGFLKIFYSYKHCALSQSDEDDTIIIILGGKSGHVCLGDRSGRSEHVPTDLKGVLLVVVRVCPFLCAREVIGKSSSRRIIVSTFLTRPKRLFLCTRRALLKGV